MRCSAHPSTDPVIRTHTTHPTANTKQTNICTRESSNNKKSVVAATQGTASAVCRRVFTETARQPGSRSVCGAAADHRRTPTPSLARVTSASRSESSLTNRTAVSGEYTHTLTTVSQGQCANVMERKTRHCQRHHTPHNSIGDAQHSPPQATIPRTQGSCKIPGSGIHDGRGNHGKVSFQ